jgi:glycosyltransferase involved in cell wall biosynthesis
VTFVGRVERSELLRIMREEADVFLFPSLRDEGGWVVGEARWSGLPVVCVDRGGPPTIAGGGVALGSRAETADRLAQAVERAGQGNLPQAAAPTFSQRQGELLTILRRHGLVGRETAASPAEEALEA